MTKETNVVDNIILAERTYEHVLIIRYAEFVGLYQGLSRLSKELSNKIAKIGLNVTCSK